MLQSVRVALLLGSAGVLAAFPAHAETAPEPDERLTLNPIILVTGTKSATAQDVQDVPLAINAFDAASLDALKVRTISDLSRMVPGVSLDQVGTFRGVANWSIRGIGINSSIASIDPAVGTFVDGVYLGINPGSSLDSFDLDRVEVLRGPQGTLYGRNVTGGAVLVNTADPTHDWQFTVRGGAETPVDGGRGSPSMTMSAVASGPIADGLAFRVGAYHNYDGGWFRNRFNGNSLGEAETTILRGGLLWDDGPLRVVGKLEYLKTTGDGAPGQNHGLFARDTFDLSIDHEGFFRAKSWFATLRADYELGSGTITNIFGWRDFRQFTSNDIDSSPQFLFHSKTGLTQEQWSNELRWAGEVAEGVSLTVGGYAFQQDVAYDEDRQLPTVTSNMFYGGGRQKHEVYGAFAQGEWRFAADLTLTAGIRWSDESKDADVTFVRTRPECSVTGKTCPIAGTNPLIPGEPNGFSDKHSWSNWTPKIGVSWDVADGVMAYASWTRGYRSGGYNLRITQPAAFLANAALMGTPTFGEERVESYELGVKLQTADGRGTLNLAAYRSDVDDMQREISLSNGGSGLAQSVYNTADARILGGEAEARFAITPNVIASANLGYIDADYTRIFYDISGDGVIGAADLALALPRVPKWTYGFGLTHNLPLGGDASVITSVRFQHRTSYAYTDNNFGWVSESDWLDADVTWNLPVNGWSISLYGRNLLDEVQFGGDTQIPYGGPLSNGVNRPFDPAPAAGTFSPLVKGRTLGVQVAAQF